MNHLLNRAIVPETQGAKVLSVQSNSRSTQKVNKQRQATRWRLKCKVGLQTPTTLFGGCATKEVSTNMAYAAPYGTISPPNYAIPVGGQVFPQQHQQQPVSMHHAPSPQAVSSPPARPGTLPVGTRIMIGQYKVTIERFLSEGRHSYHSGVGPKFKPAVHEASAARFPLRGLTRPGSQRANSYRTDHDALLSSTQVDSLTCTLRGLHRPSTWEDPVRPSMSSSDSPCPTSRNCKKCARKSRIW